MIDALTLIQAAVDTAGAYGRFPVIGARGAVWIAAQVHLMFAAFVLGVPMFAVITELIGIVAKDSKYDKLSKEFTRLLVFAYSATALWGGLLLFLLTTLYPRFWGHMARVLGPSMWLYAGLFFIESFTLYLYYYGWDRWKFGRAKWGHWALGLLLNVWGTIVMFIANGWLTYMMSDRQCDLDADQHPSPHRERGVRRLHRGRVCRVPFSVRADGRGTGAL
jgi:hypothetical protein